MKEEEDQTQRDCFQEQILMHNQYQYQNDDVFGIGTGFISPPMMTTTSFPHHQLHGFNQFLSHPPPPPSPAPPPPPPPSSFASFFNRRNPSSLQFPYEICSNNVGIGPSEVISKMTAQEIMDAKALAASKSHSEAERRRRERINNHLAKLRSLLPSTTKTDKASLLAEVIQHVKELKRQTTLIADISPVPTELDELSVDVDAASDEHGKFVIKASLCCEDRSDLLPQIIKALKSLHLRTLKAEITTLGGRVKNVLFITGEEDCGAADRYCVNSIQEALKAVMEKCGDDQSSSGSIKRQRTNHNISSH